MTADIEINEGPKQRPSRTTSSLLYTFFNVDNKEEYVRKLAEDCMCHHCNKFCMRDLKRNKHRTQRVGFGDEENSKKAETPGMSFIEQSSIISNKKQIKQFCIKSSHLKRVVQHSQTLLKFWRTNCDLKLLLYQSGPNCPGIGKIEDVCKYLVAYTGKQNDTTQSVHHVQNMHY